jgi:hypothetical protein
VRVAGVRDACYAGRQRRDVRGIARVARAEVDADRDAPPERAGDGSLERPLDVAA